jgi:hypothetical protein
MQPTSWKRPFKATISVDFKPTFRRVMLELTHRGQNRPDALAAIAGAAFPRGCSASHLAAQHFSPKQPFKLIKCAGSQTDHSLHGA